MYWFHRPPYFRFSAALLLLVIALWGEFRPPTTEDFPVAISDISSGTLLTEEMFELRALPSGTVPLVPIQGVNRTDLHAGDLLRPSDISTNAVEIPPDWWTIAMPLDQDVHPGDQVRLILRVDDGVVDGIVVATGTDEADNFGFSESVAIVAVPPDQAASVAQAVADRQIVALVRNR